MTVVARATTFARELASLHAALLLLAAISFVSSLGIAVMLPLIPLYALSLGATPAQLGLLISAFSLTNTASQLGSGMLLDRFGSRLFIRAGVATYAGANALIATAQDALSLIGYRSLAGLGAGANILANRLYLTEVADPARLGFVNGVLSAAASAGNVIGPAFGGVVAQLSDLRVPFVIVAVTSGLAFVGTLFLPAPRGRAPAAAPEGAPLSALNRSVVALFFANLALSAGYGGFIVSFSPLAQDVLGWSTFEIGAIFTAFGAGAILLGPGLGHLADRTGRKRVAFLSTLPLALFGIAAALAMPRPVIYAAMFLAGASITGFTAAWFALLAAASPVARRGRTFGVVSALSNLGVVAGATAASLVWELVGLQPAILTASVAVLLSAAALLALPKERSA